jgi:hypothetical protein
MPGTWLMKIVMSAIPRQKSTALASRGIPSTPGQQPLNPISAVPWRRLTGASSYGGVCGRVKTFCGSARR